MYIEKAISHVQKGQSGMYIEIEISHVNRKDNFTCI